MLFMLFPCSQAKCIQLTLFSLLASAAAEEPLSRLQRQSFPCPLNERLEGRSGRGGSETIQVVWSVAEQGWEEVASGCLPDPLASAPACVVGRNLFSLYPFPFRMAAKAMPRVS